MFVVVRHMQEQRAGTTAVVSSNAVTTPRWHKSHAGIKSYTVRGVAQCGFARFDRCTVLRRMRQSDTDRLEQIIADTPHKSTTKTRLTCWLMATPLDSFLTHHPRSTMARHPLPTDQAARRQFALQHAALLGHDMQEYFITAYDRNVNPMGTALSNIRSIISFTDLRGMERNTAEVLSA